MDEEGVFSVTSAAGPGNGLRVKCHGSLSEDRARRDSSVCPLIVSLSINLVTSS